MKFLRTKSNEPRVDMNSIHIYEYAALRCFSFAVCDFMNFQKACWPKICT